MPEIVPVILAHAMPTLPALDALRTAWPDMPEPILLHTSDDPAAREYARFALDTLTVDARGEASAYSVPLSQMPARSFSPHLSALSRLSAGLSSGCLFIFRGDITRIFWRISVHATAHQLPAYSIGRVLSAACRCVLDQRALFFRTASGAACACLFRAATPPAFLPSMTSCLEQSITAAELTPYAWIEPPLPLTFDTAAELSTSLSRSHPLPVPET